MQPYIPYFVIEALAADRTREIEGRKPEPFATPRLELRRHLGTVLVRLGSRIQRPFIETAPRAT